VREVLFCVRDCSEPDCRTIVHQVGFSLQDYIEMHGQQRKIQKFIHLLVLATNSYITTASTTFNVIYI
jgi:hypothetical protein